MVQPGKPQCPAAYRKGPLVTPELVFERETFTVRICLDDPIVPPPDIRELVALCAAADVLVERAIRLQQFNSFDMQVLSEVQAVCEELFPYKQAQDALEELGLLRTFPYLEQALLYSQLQFLSSSQGAAYFSYISQLNQLVFLSTQMYHDACNPQYHKYMAHQVALLYQSLNQLQGQTKPLRRAVEARFDEIKAVTESPDPVFDAEMSEWLQNFAAHCHIEVSTMPRYIHKRLEPMMSLIKDPGGAARLSALASQRSQQQQQDQQQVHEQHHPQQQQQEQGYKPQQQQQEALQEQEQRLQGQQQRRQQVAVTS